MSTAESKEPTMEEILASIRRIISEEGEAGAEAAAPAPAIEEETPEDIEAQAAALEDDEDSVFFDEESNDVLELTDSLTPPAAPVAPPRATPVSRAPEEALVSESTVEVASQSLSSLSGLLVRSYPGAGNTLDGLVREMLRPMLKEWLDAHLPDMVEQMVSREIARISGRAK